MTKRGLAAYALVLSPLLLVTGHAAQRGCEANAKGQETASKVTWAPQEAQEGLWLPQESREVVQDTGNPGEPKEPRESRQAVGNRPQNRQEAARSTLSAGVSRQEHRKQAAKVRLQTQEGRKAPRTSPKALEAAKDSQHPKNTSKAGKKGGWRGKAVKASHSQQEPRNARVARRRQGKDSTKGVSKPQGYQEMVPHPQRTKELLPYKAPSNHPNEPTTQSREVKGNALKAGEKGKGKARLGREGGEERVTAQRVYSVPKATIQPFHARVPALDETAIFRIQVQNNALKN